MTWLNYVNTHLFGRLPTLVSHHDEVMCGFVERMLLIVLHQNELMIRYILHTDGSDVRLYDDPDLMLLVFSSFGPGLFRLCPSRWRLTLCMYRLFLIRSRLLSARGPPGVPYSCLTI